MEEATLIAGDAITITGERDRSDFPQVGDTWVHAKTRTEYVIHAVVLDEKTLTHVVIYEAKSGGPLWSRGIADFLGVDTWSQGRLLFFRFVRKRLE